MSRDRQTSGNHPVHYFLRKQNLLRKQSTQHPHLAASIADSDLPKNQKPVMDFRATVRPSPPVSNATRDAVLENSPPHYNPQCRFRHSPPRSPPLDVLNTVLNAGHEPLSKAA